MVTPPFPRHVLVRLAVLGAGLVVAGARPAWPAAPAQAQPTLPPEAYRRVTTWNAVPQPRLAGEFTLPAGVDVGPDGNVYVVDQGEHTIHVLKDGRGVRVIGRRGSELGELLSPADVAVGQGRLYVSDTGNGRLQVFDAATGGFISVLGGWANRAAWRSARTGFTSPISHSRGSACSRSLASPSPPGEGEAPASRCPSSALAA